MDEEVSEVRAGGRAAARVRDLVREICGQHEVKILKGHVSKDHVDLLVSIPPPGNGEPTGAMAEGENGTQDHAGVPTYQKALLGTAHVGARLLLL
jgi:Transposase IS200 like